MLDSQWHQQPEMEEMEASLGFPFLALLNSILQTCSADSSLDTDRRKRFTLHRPFSIFQNVPVRCLVASLQDDLSSDVSTGKQEAIQKRNSHLDIFRLNLDLIPEGYEHVKSLLSINKFSDGQPLSDANSIGHLQITLALTWGVLAESVEVYKSKLKQQEGNMHIATLLAAFLHDLHEAYVGDVVYGGKTKEFKLMELAAMKNTLIYARKVLEHLKVADADKIIEDAFRILLADQGMKKKYLDPDRLAWSGLSGNFTISKDKVTIPNQAGVVGGGMIGNEVYQGFMVLGFVSEGDIQAITGEGCESYFNANRDYEIAHKLGFLLSGLSVFLKAGDNIEYKAFGIELIINGFGDLIGEDNSFITHVIRHNKGLINEAIDYLINNFASVSSYIKPVIGERVATDGYLNRLKNSLPK